MPAPICTVAVPALVSELTYAFAGSVSTQATSASGGVSSWMLTTEPTWKWPARRHDHDDGLSKASAAVTLIADPPLTLKLKSRPRKDGVSVSLQILRSPKLPPAGWFTYVTRVSLLADVPAGTETTTLRLVRSVLT